ncbi:MAG: carboxypeptidase-like regulatory domain-containing protein [Pirellula sp.]
MDKKQFYQAVLAALLLIVACGTLYWAFTRTEEVPLILSKASLKGKVLYKGKAVPHALIVVSGSETSSSAQADAQGHFRVEHAPPGKVAVGVNTEAGKGMMRGAAIAAAMSGSKADMPTFVDLPAKFFAPETSGLSIEVKNKDGENEQDILIN